MSRRGWSTANFFRLTSAVVSAAPLTIAAWGTTSITGSLQLICQISNATDLPNQESFELTIDTANKINATAFHTATTGSAVSTTTITANVSFNACAVFTSATSRAAYLNGGGKGTNATSVTPGTMTKTSIGAIDAGTVVNPFAPSGTGDIGEVAIWKIDLSDGDVLRLASGISALAVQREFLVGYWQLNGGGANEINVINPTQPMALQGALTLSAPPPRFFMPRSPALVIAGVL